MTPTLECSLPCNLDPRGSQKWLKLLSCEHSDPNLLSEPQHQPWSSSGRLRGAESIPGLSMGHLKPAQGTLGHSHCSG